MLQNLGDIIKEELNIKQIEKIEDESKFNDEFLTVNFKKAGAVLKGEVQLLKNALLNASVSQMEEYVKEYKQGKVNVDKFADLDSELFNLEKKAKKEFVISHENGITVALDITIDDELIMEGLYREFVRGLQVLRKTADFAIDERIEASFASDDDKMNEMLNLFNDKIKSEVLIKQTVEKIENPTIEKEIEVGQGKIKVAFKGAK